MAQIELVMTTLDGLDKTYKKFANEIDDVMKSVKKTQGKLNNQVEAKMSIDNRFARIQNLLSKEKTYFNQAGKLCDTAYADFKRIDTQQANILKGTDQVPTVKSTIQSVLTSNYISKYGSMAGFLLAGSSALMKSELTKWNTNMTTMNKSIQSTTIHMKEEISQKTLDEITARYKNLPNSISGKGFAGRCGALTYQQLNAMGVVGDGEVTEFGKNYAKFLAKKGKTATGYTCTGYTGKNAFDTLLKEHKLPLTNIVCSFSTGGDFKSEAGHAMLITKIDEEGYVYFVDNVRATSNYKAVRKTLEEFKEFYFKSSNKCNGVTYLHK